MTEGSPASDDTGDAGTGPVGEKPTDPASDRIELTLPMPAATVIVGVLGLLTVFQLVGFLVGPDPARLVIALVFGAATGGAAWMARLRKVAHVDLHRNHAVFHVAAYLDEPLVLRRDLFGRAEPIRDRYDFRQTDLALHATNKRPNLALRLREPVSLPVGGSVVGRRVAGTTGYDLGYRYVDRVLLNVADPAGIERFLTWADLEAPPEGVHPVSLPVSRHWLTYALVGLSVIWAVGSVVRNALVDSEDEASPPTTGVVVDRPLDVTSATGELVGPASVELSAIVCGQPVGLFADAVETSAAVFVTVIGTRGNCGVYPLRVELNEPLAERPLIFESTSVTLIEVDGELVPPTTNPESTTTTAPASTTTPTTSGAAS